MGYEYIYENINGNFKDEPFYTSNEFYDVISRQILTSLIFLRNIENIIPGETMCIKYNDINLFDIEYKIFGDISIIYDHNGDISGVEKGEYHVILNDKYYIIFNRDLSKYRDNMIDKIIS